MTFRGKYRFLSNFYDHPIEYEGVKYKTTEHAYQALKFFDPAIKEQIINTPFPGQAKRLARKYKDHVNPDWIDKRLKIMYDINKIKFSDPKMAEMLANVNEPIIESNTWGDTFWGVDLESGEGHNHLGKILERIKQENEVFTQ